MTVVTVVARLVAMQLCQSAGLLIYLVLDVYNSIFSHYFSVLRIA